MTSIPKNSKTTELTSKNYQQLFSIANETIVVADATTGELIDVNQQALLLFEYDREELIGQNQTMLHPKAKREYYRQEFHYHVQHEGLTAPTNEYEIITKFGHIKPVEITTTIVNLEGRKIILGFFRDISARKRAENSLRRSELSLKAAQRIAHLGNWDWDLTVDSLYWSDEMYQILGLDPGDIEPGYETFKQYIHPDDLREVDKAIQAALHGEQPEPLDHRIITEDGEERVIHQEFEITTDESRAPIKMLGTIHDITSQKHAEDLIKKNKELQKSLNGLLQISLQDVSLPILLNNILDELLSISWLPVKDKGAIFLYNEEKEQLELVAHKNFSSEHQQLCQFVEEGQCLCGKVASTREMYFTSKINHNHDFQPDFMSPHGHYVVPVQSEDTFYGVFIIYLNEGHQENQEEKNYLNAVAQTIASIIKRRHSEREIQQLSQIVKQTDDIVYITNHHGVIEYANPSFYTKTGFSKEDVIGKNPRILKSGKHPEVFYKKMWDQITSGKIYQGIVMNRNKEGELYFEEKTITPIRNSQDEITHFVSTGKDVTEQMKSQQALKKSERKFRSIFEGAAFGILVLDKQGKINDCNHAFESMVGTDAGELIGRSFFELAHPGDIERCRQNFQKVLNGRVSECGLEHRLQKYDGGVIWTNLQGSRFPAESQQEHIIVIAEDITEQKQTDAALRRSEQNYREIIEHMQEGFYRCTRDGKILFVNPRMVEMLEYTEPEELIGKTFIELEITALADFLNLQKKLAHNKEVSFYETEWRTKSGTSLIVKQNIHLYYNAESGEQYFEGTVENISEQKELEQQLIQSQKLESLGEIAGGIAHDFNNVMSIIKGATQLIKMDVEDSRLAQNADMILGSIERGKSITDRMLTFTRQDDPVFETVPVNRFLEGIKKVCEHSLPKTIHTKLDLPVKEYYLRADYGQIQQVLLNMAINGSHAMPDGGELTLGVRIPPDSIVKKHIPNNVDQYVCITVTDTGIGMDSDAIQKIFDPFYTTKKRGEGTGLGLSVAHTIVKNHQGFIDVKSARGQGTTFHIGLPITGVKETAKTEKYTPEIATGAHILMVEDERKIRHLLQEVLSEHGYKVTVAKHGQEALRIFKKNPKIFDLILSDIGLPDLNGINLVEQLKKFHTCKAVAMTGHYFDSVSLTQNRLFAEVLQKPFDFDQLLMTLEEVLAD